MTETEVQLQEFDFKGNNLQAINLNNEPWFVGKSLTNILEYKNPTKALRDNVDDEDQQTLTYKASNQKLKATLWRGNDYSNKTLVNESGVYSLVLRSTMKEAREFKHWVTSEVLPSIRKHGAYMTYSTLEQVANNPDLLIKLANNLKTEREARKQAELQIENEKSDVQFAKAVGNAGDLISVGSMANILSKNGVDIGRTRLYDWMRKYHLVQQKSCKPTQYSINSNVLKVQETHSVDSYGHDHVNIVSRVTTKGQKYILQKFDIVGGEINLLNKGVE